jgi:hypothetical protein
VKIVSIACSDTEVLFLDNMGIVYNLIMNAVLRVFAMPQIVSIAVGPQHCAAVSSDAELFTWGFNPSGQLGIGSDRSLAYPKLVLENVVMVGCGSQHTLVVTNDDLKLGRMFDESQVVPVKPGAAGEYLRLTRCELLS